MLNPALLARNNEQFEEFRSAILKKQRIQYDYRHSDGTLFTCVASTLIEARSRRDNWISAKSN